MLLGSLIQKRILSEHREIRDFLELRADQAAQGGRVAQSRLSEAEHQTRWLPEEQKEYLLPEAVEMQELRVESAGSLQESRAQGHFQMMKLYQANQLSDHSQIEKSWMYTELDRREGVLQEDRVRCLQEIEELKKLCCAEAERAKQLRIHELSV